MNDTFTFGSAGLIHELELGMRRAGGWDQSLVKLLSSGDHLVHVREYLRGRSEIIARADSPPSVPTLTVPADLPFAERIVRGRYDWTNSDLTEKKFPVTADQVGEWEWKPYHFNNTIDSNEAVHLIQKDGFQPGQIGHLLAFGEAYPEEQWKYPIIALGSVAEVSLIRYVPVLWGGGNGRGLGLGGWGVGWGAYFRFLGVRRPSAA